jgi:hypothetical protein
MIVDPIETTDVIFSDTKAQRLENSTIWADQISCFPYPKKEAEPASEALCFIKRLDDGWITKQEY